MGGLGERFKNAGYNIPKPLINVLGKPILYWLLDNLNINNDIILIPYNSALEKYNFENKLMHDYPNINFLFYKLDNNTNGCAESIYIMLNKLSFDDCPIICIDCDNFYNTDMHAVGHTVLIHTKNYWNFVNILLIITYVKKKNFIYLE